MKKIVVAIDGYSACGKSTLARQLARRLGYIYVDSGAMYRAITLYFIRNDIRWSDENAVIKALKNISLEFVPDTNTNIADMWLNGENVERPIREITVANKVSEIAAIPRVREFAVASQRNMRNDQGIVMDGRDVGTVVFPDAELKIFMTADVNVRVERRYKEVQQKKENVSREEIKENLATRDYTDTHRAVGPLREAKDAVVLDNTHLTEKEQLEFVLRLVQEIVGG